MNTYRIDLDGPSTSAQAQHRFQGGGLPGVPEAWRVDRSGDAGAGSGPGASGGDSGAGSRRRVHGFPARPSRAARTVPALCRRCCSCWLRAVQRTCAAHGPCSHPRFWRIATRYDKLAEQFASLICLVGAIACSPSCPPIPTWTRTFPLARLTSRWVRRTLTTAAPSIAFDRRRPSLTNLLRGTRSLSG